MHLRTPNSNHVDWETLSEDPEFDLIADESKDSEILFTEGFYSDELPSEILKRRTDDFFPNHF